MKEGNVLEKKKKQCAMTATLNHRDGDAYTGLSSTLEMGLGACEEGLSVQETARKTPGLRRPEDLGSVTGPRIDRTARLRPALLRRKLLSTMIYRTTPQVLAHRTSHSSYHTLGQSPSRSHVRYYGNFVSRLRQTSMEYLFAAKIGSSQPDHTVLCASYWYLILTSLFPIFSRRRPPLHQKRPGNLVVDQVCGSTPAPLPPNASCVCNKTVLSFYTIQSCICARSLSSDHPHFNISTYPDRTS